jgi:integration host factor subunit beta
VWSETVTKSELVESISTTAPHWTKRQVERAVNTIFGAMTGALAEGDRIEIRGLGSFKVKTRQARRGRNPKTGDAVDIPSRRVPSFTAGKQLRARVEGA